VAVAALVSLIAAGCSSGNPQSVTTTTASGSSGNSGTSGSTGNSAAQALTTVTTQPATTTTAQPDTMVITGTGPASVTINDNFQISQHNGASLPYTYTITDNPPIAGIGAQTASGSPSASITCTISGPSVVGSPVTKTSTGAYAVVQCSTQLNTS